MSSQVSTIWNDPQFHALPPEERRKVLLHFDPDNFGALPKTEQDKVLQINPLDAAPNAPPAPQSGVIDRFLRSFGQATGAPPDPHDYLSGPAYAIEHPIDSAKLIGSSILDTQGNELEKTKQAWDAGDIPGVISHGLGYAVPVAGPMLASAGEQMKSGDIAGGLGTTTGAIAPMLMAKIPEVIEATKAARNTPPSTAWNRVFNPSNPGKTAGQLKTGGPFIVEALRDNGIKLDKTNPLPQLKQGIEVAMNKVAQSIGPGAPDAENAGNVFNALSNLKRHIENAEITPDNNSIKINFSPYAAAKFPKVYLPIKGAEYGLKKAFQSPGDIANLVNAFDKYKPDPASSFAIANKGARPEPAWKSIPPDPNRPPTPEPAPFNLSKHEVNFMKSFEEQLGRNLKKKLTSNPEIK